MQVFTSITRKSKLVIVSVVLLLWGAPLSRLVADRAFAQTSRSNLAQQSAGQRKPPVVPALFIANGFEAAKTALPTGVDLQKRAQEHIRFSFSRSTPSQMAATALQGVTTFPLLTGVDYKVPALSADQLKILGVTISDVPQTASRVSADAYDRMPYGFSDAYSYGLRTSAGYAGWRDAYRAVPGGFDLATVRSGLSVDGTVLANALAKADQSTAYISNFLGALTGGGWNQFYGQLAYPGAWGASYQNNDPFYSGAGGTANSWALQAVLGYDSGSPYSFGTQYLMNLNSALYQPWNTNNGFGGLSKASSAELNGLEDIQNRYSALGWQQLGYYYFNGDLSSLRYEANNYLLALLYLDPVYLYFSHAISLVVNDFALRAPSYNQTAALYYEVSSWTTPASDLATLRSRYEKRQQLADAYNNLIKETLTAVLNNATWGSWVLEVNAFLLQRLQENWTISQAVTWNSDWSSRWQNTFAANSGYSNLVNRYNQITQQYPAFEEYLQLNLEVVERLPAYETDPQTVRVRELTANLLQNTTVAGTVSNSYTSYTTTVKQAVRSTNFSAEVERYFERANQLLANDPTYRDLYSNQYYWVTELTRYHEIMFNEVLPYAQQGRWDLLPYDPEIQYYLNRNYTFQVIANVGGFYELNNSYLQSFYASTAFANLEDDSQARIQSALQPVAQSIQNAGARFNNEVTNISQIRTLNTERNSLLAKIRNNSFGIDRRLTDMAKLLEELRSSTAVKERENGPPASLSLLQNYPNPFTPSTTIAFTLPQRERVRLEIFNLLGEKVATLLNETRAPGMHSVAWQTQNLPSGTYLYRLETKTHSQTRKLLLVR